MFSLIRTKFFNPLNSLWNNKEVSAKRLQYTKVSWLRQKLLNFLSDKIDGGFTTLFLKSRRRFYLNLDNSTGNSAFSNFPNSRKVVTNPFLRLSLLSVWKLCRCKAFSDARYHNSTICNECQAQLCKGLGPASTKCLSRRFQLHPTTCKCVSSRFSSIVD